MAFRRPTLLFCIVTIVLGVSYKANRPLLSEVADVEHNDASIQEINSAEVQEHCSNEVQTTLTASSRRALSTRAHWKKRRCPRDLRRCPESGMSKMGGAALTEGAEVVRKQAPGSSETGNPPVLDLSHNRRYTAVFAPTPALATLSISWWKHLEETKKLHSSTLFHTVTVEGFTLSETESFAKNHTAQRRPWIDFIHFADDRRSCHDLPDSCNCSHTKAHAHRNAENVDAEKQSSSQHTHLKVNGTIEFSEEHLFRVSNFTSAKTAAGKPYGRIREDETSETSADERTKHACSFEENFQWKGTNRRCVKENLQSKASNGEYLYGWKSLYNASLKQHTKKEHTHPTQDITTFEHKLSLVSLCLMLMIFKNEDLKEKILVPFSHAFPQANQIRNLIQAIMKNISTVCELTSPTSSHDLGLQASDDLGRQRGEGKGLLIHDEDCGFGHSPVKIGKQDMGGEKPDVQTVDAEEDTPQTKSKEKASTGGHFYKNRLHVTIPTVYVTYPVAFLPSMATSPTDKMSHLGCRLASLTALPASCDVSRVRLAQAGFYYDNSKTARDASNVHEVVCYSCGVTYAGWKKGDNPTVIHQNLKPECDHLKSLATVTTSPGNFSSMSSSGGSSSEAGVSNGVLSTSESSAWRSMSSGYSSMSSGASRQSSSPQSSLSSSDSGLASGFGPGADAGLEVPVYAALQADNGARRNDGGDLMTDCAAIVPAPLTSSGHVARAANQPMYSGPARDSAAPNPSTQGSFYGPRDTCSARISDMEDHPPLLMDRAVYPQFSLHHERLVTFTNWPLATIFHPEDLVMQGFYYAGYTDCLRCFYCGVGLKSWAQNDDIMTEHIRFRPHCGYILSIKGRAFVQSVLDRIQISSNWEQNSGHGDSSVTASQQKHPSAATAPPSNASGNRAADPPAPRRDTAASGSPSSGASSSRSLPAATASAASGGNDEKEVLKQVEEMGFGKDSIARAVHRLQQSGVTRITTDALVESLLDDNANTNATTTTAQQNGLDTDGPEEASSLLGSVDSERAQRLVRENERLKARQTCKICREARVGMIFLPCGHIVACTQCGSKTRNCSNCGQFIRATANVYLS